MPRREAEWITQSDLSIALLLGLPRGHISGLQHVAKLGPLVSDL